jgi:hypothetical protein
MIFGIQKASKMAHLRLIANRMSTLQCKPVNTFDPEVSHSTANA